MTNENKHTSAGDGLLCGQLIGFTDFVLDPLRFPGFNTVSKLARRASNVSIPWLIVTVFATKTPFEDTRRKINARHPDSRHGSSTPKCAEVVVLGVCALFILLFWPQRAQSRALWLTVAHLISHAAVQNEYVRGAAIQSLERESQATPEALLVCFLLCSCWKSME